MHPDLYAREVAREMLALRGWRSNVPSEVRDDVFATMERHRARYTACYAQKDTPAYAAKVIQNAEWDNEGRTA